MNPEKFSAKGEKVLYAIYLLDKEKKENITVEDVAVKLWKLYPEEFCMKGYPEFPNVDIQKYFTKLFRKNYITGGVSRYVLKEKGKIEIERILREEDQIKSKKSATNSTLTREVHKELDRILKSKVFEYYITTESPEFLEIDLFEFLGSSPRSLKQKSKSNFQSQLNKIQDDVITYCRENEESNKQLGKVVELWETLYQRFGGILNEN